MRHSLVYWKICITMTLLWTMSVLVYSRKIFVEETNWLEATWNLLTNTPIMLSRRTQVERGLSATTVRRKVTPKTNAGSYTHLPSRERPLLGHLSLIQAIRPIMLLHLV